MKGTNTQRFKWSKLPKKKKVNEEEIHQWTALWNVERAESELQAFPQSSHEAAAGPGASALTTPPSSGGSSGAGCTGPAERGRKGHVPTPARPAFPGTKPDKTTKQKRTDQYFLWAPKQVSSKSTSNPIQYINRWQITIEQSLSWGRRLLSVQKARNWSHQETKKALIITSIDTCNNSGKNTGKIQHLFMI